MTKKLFLAAASVAAMAFAGGANAGVITGHFGAASTATTKFNAAPSAATYKVASERVVSADEPITGTITATNKLENDIVVGAASRDFLVTFTVTGATPTLTSLVVTHTGLPADVSSSLVGVSNGVATYLVSVKDSTVSQFALKATVTQKAQAPITVSGNVVAIIGGTNITVDTAAAVTAAEYKPMLGALKVADAHVLQADLDDYVTLEDGLLTAHLADNFSFVSATVFHEDLAADVLTAGEVLGGGVITVRGPLISENVTVALAGTLDADNTEVNTAVFNLTAGEAATFAAGAEDLIIKQAAKAADQEAFRAGTYRVTWAPKAADGYTVPGTSSVDAGTITLEGTNFVAPWVSGTGAAASVIRVANSNSADSGAVTVRLLNAVKVVAGVATPVASSVVYQAGTVPAGADLQITSAQLVAAFGDFTRGDVQVTINSADDGFTAKMRSTRDGQTFEQSLSHSDIK